VLEAAMPCLISVTKAIGEPRYPSLKGIMQAKKKEIVRWTLTDIGVDASLVGTNNAHTRVIGTSKPRARGQAIIIKDSPEVAAHRLADYLSDIKAF
jgi:electron transfer flavoprotein beta subunit